MRLIFLTLTLMISLALPAHAADELRESFNKTLSLCDSHWTAYTSALDELKGKAARYVSGLSTEDYLRLWDADDALLVFISGTWPEILGNNKVAGPWDSCVGQHTILLRRTIADRSLDAKARLNAVEDWRACVGASYTLPTLIKPFDRVAKCYKGQAAAFKE